jgi:hypothetical protein
MPIHVRCPGCEMQYKLADHLAGKKIRCKECSQVMAVPGVAPAPTQEAVTAKQSRPAATPAAPVPKPPREEALQPPRKNVNPPPVDSDDDPDMPRRRGKSKRESSARKGMPVAMLVGLIVGGFAIVGGVAFGAYAYFVQGGSEPAPKSTAQAPGQPDQRLQIQAEQKASAAKEANKGKGPKGETLGKMPGKKKGGPGKGEPKGDPKGETPQEIPMPIDGAVSYVTHIKPLLSNYCGGCHGANMQKSGANFESLSAIKKGGKSGLPLIVPNDPDNSYLVTRVEAQQKGMPPKGKRLSDAEKKMLRTWIVDGAKDDSPNAGTAPGGELQLGFGSVERTRWVPADPRVLVEMLDLPALHIGDRVSGLHH